MNRQSTTFCLIPAAQVTEVQEKHYEGQTPFLLSGGIRLELLPQLLRFSHPQLIGFDLNSGFESAPGLKDAQRIQSFINQLKQTNV